MKVPTERRCVLLLLAAMSVALVVGLLAWGPVPLVSDDHRFADSRRWFGVPNAMNVLVNLVVLLVGAWGWRATRRSHWPALLRQPWQGFHLGVMGGAVMASLYHLAPSPALYVLSHTAMATAFVLLCCGALSERVHLRFGSRRGVRQVLSLVLLLSLSVPLGAWLTGTVDLRPLLLLEWLPVLLIPTGAIGLPGRVTRTGDWLLMLSIYALAKLFELADDQVFQATGWLSGHTLMHLNLAAGAGWLAYRASLSPARDASGPAPMQEHTSLNTAA